MDNGQVEIIDFGLPTTPKKFRLYAGGEIFEAAPDLPLNLMPLVAKFSSLRVQDDPEGALDAVFAVTDAVFVGDSATRFRAEVQAKRVGVNGIMAVMKWVVEGYALRPLVPSVSSSSTQEDAGTSSTAGAPAEESIPSL